MWRLAPWLPTAAAFGGLIGFSIDKLSIGLFTRGIAATAIAWVLSLFFVATGFLFVSPFAGEKGGAVLPWRTLLTAFILAGLVGSLARYAGLGFDVRFRTVILGMVGALAGTIQGLLAGASEAIEEA